jgi:thiol-disulfide isomerase/thioredoxin
MKIGIKLAIIGVLILGTSGLIFFARIRANEITIASGIAVGDTAVNLKFTTIDGSTFNLGDKRGKMVVVDFTTTSCPVCVEELKVLKQLQSDESLVLVSVNVDSASLADLQLFASHYELSWDVGNSQQAGVDYKVSGVPTLLVIDRSGVIRYRGYYTDLEQLVHIINQDA